MMAKLPDEGYQIQHKPTVAPRLKYVISDVDRFGTRRWYLRIPGYPKTRLPCGPGDPEFEKVYIAALRGAPPPIKVQKREKRDRDDVCYVYFLRTGSTVKIGYSAKPLNRCGELKTGFSEPISTLVAVPGTLTDERNFHREFEKFRLEGEWFRMCPQIASAMAQVAVYGIAREPPKRRIHSRKVMVELLGARA
jgi:hypothetical protein